MNEQRDNSGIYQIACSVNGHRYIGSAVNLGSRFRVHGHHLKKGTHHSRHLQNAWNKYGQESFKFEILELVEAAKLIETEQEWMDRVNPEYNIERIAGSGLGVKRTPEQLRRFSEAQKKAAKHRVVWNKGKTGVFSDETIAKIKAARAKQIVSRGYKWTAEMRAAHSKRCMGRKMPPRSLQHRMRLSKSLTGKQIGPMSEVTKLKLSRSLRNVWLRKKEEAQVNQAELSL